MATTTTTDRAAEARDELELLVGLLQPIHHLHAVLKVHVVIEVAVHEQQVLRGF